MTDEMAARYRYAFNCTNWIPNKPEWLRGMSCIQQEERERIAKLVYQRDTKMALIGRLLIRKVITLLLEVTNSEVHLQRTEKGRPYIAEPHSFRASRLDFNVSHQGDYTVLAAGRRVACGVDVMRIDMPSGGRSASQFFDLMQRQITPNEMLVIRDPKKSEAEQMRLFYRHWCLKESFVKATGEGIGYDLSRIECRLQSGLTPPELTAPGLNPTEWRFEEHALDDKHVAAIAWNAQNSEEPNLNSHFRMLSFPDLVVDCGIISKADTDLWDNFKAKEPLPPRLISQAAAAH